MFSIELTSQKVYYFLPSQMNKSPQNFIGIFLFSCQQQAPNILIDTGGQLIVLSKIRILL